MSATAVRRAGVLLVLALVATLCVQVASAVVTPVRAAVTSRILITGDSLAQGSSGDYTWRYRLWNKLSSTAPGSVAFVGPRTDLYDVVNSQQGSQYYAASFAAKAHGALWGDSIRDELGKIGPVVAAANANVLVVMLGSNDLTYLTSPEATVANLKTYITQARAAAPGIDVVVGEVVNRYDPWSGDSLITAQANEFATRLATLATQLNTSAERVVVAPTRTGWNAKTLTWDGTHPNPSGEALIAQRVSEGLAKIGVGTASPDVSGTKAWAVAGPGVGLAPGSEQMGLSWSRTSTGATGMYIEQRLVNTGEAWKRLPYPVSGNSWTAELLAAGGTYEYRVVPVKGFMTGDAGPAASATVGGPTPYAVSSVDATAGGDSSYGGKRAYASWPAATNATGYLLSSRLATDAGAAWDDLPYAVTERTWTFEPLAQGRRYEFRVRGTRGYLRGAWEKSDATRMHGWPADSVQVSIGDSYSSGLGSSSATENTACKRHSGAWAYKIFAAFRVGMLLKACAGDTTAGVRQQLPDLNAFFAARPGKPQLITLTVGGNDVGFSDELEKCIKGACVNDEYTLNAKIDAERSELMVLYQDIRDAHPYADVLVGGYPGVLQVGGGSNNLLCLAIGGDEREMVSRLVTRLNDRITSAAASARVWSVGQRVRDAFEGHNACTGGNDEWIHAGSYSLGGIGGVIDPESFHPNDGGQFTYAQVVNDAITDKS